MQPFFSPIGLLRRALDADRQRVIVFCDDCLLAVARFRRRFQAGVDKATSLSTRTGITVTVHLIRLGPELNDLSS